MTLFKSNKRAAWLALALAFALLCSFSATMSGQTSQLQLPQPQGHVNDFAGVINSATRQRLENILVNLKQRTGIEFVIATVQTVGDQDLYGYSTRLAGDWDIGSRTSLGKSLLLVIVSDSGKHLTLQSRSVLATLPDGLVGNMGQRMEPQFQKARYNDGLLDGIQTFVSGLGERLGFTFAAMDQQALETPPAQQTRQRRVGGGALQPGETPQPKETPKPNETPTPVPETAVVVTPEPVGAVKPQPETAAPSPSAAVTPQPTETPTPTPAPPVTPAPQATETPTPSPAAAASPQPSETEAPSPSAMPSAQSAEAPAPSPSATVTPQPTETPTPTPAPATPTPQATETATPSPAAAASPQPSEAPTAKPVETTSPQPSESGTPAAIARSSPQPSESSSNLKKAVSSASDDDEREEVELTLTQPPDKRIEELKAFIEAHPRSVANARAAELIIMTRATLGDQKLQLGDTEGGLREFRQAFAEAPREISERLFTEVIARIPVNLFLRGQRAAAYEAARQAEALAKLNPTRLLAVAQFYLSIEDAAEANRVAELAVQAGPELAAGHLGVGAARQIALRVNEAEREFARALELDPKSSAARRGLADLKRAAGKADEALALYRELLKADSNDQSATAGLVLSLFDAGKKEDAERELSAALKNPRPNLPLLVGAAYWLVAHNESERALVLARSALEVEQRYTWAYIALARALVSQKQPLDAERALRLARQFGRFPTLDYELATVLASVGLYEEAAEELSRSFTLKDGQIETRLAGRIPARAANFIELLGPERRASIFQPVAADTEANARTLKALLAFTAALNSAEGQVINEENAITAAREFAAGEDAMRAYRQTYAASRLLKKGIALRTVLELALEAANGVEAAVDVPAATVAVQADELRDIRVLAIAAGGTPALPDAARAVRANLLRGRIEDLAGWALFNQEQATEAVEHLRLAVSVLPEGTPLWRAALWHLGAALEASGRYDQALLYYIKSYLSGDPDPVHRGVIESVYKKLNGTLEGLEDKIGPASPAATRAPTPATPVPAASPAATPTPSPPPSAEATPKAGAPAPESTPSPTPSPPSPSATPLVETRPGPTPTPAPESTPSPTPASPPSPSATPLVETTPGPTPTPAPESTPSPTPTNPSPSPTPPADPTPGPDSAGPGINALTHADAQPSAQTGMDTIEYVSSVISTLKRANCYLAAGSQR